MYKRRIDAVVALEDYALFVMFFPVLVAGPIERAGHMMPKLLRPRVLTVDQTTRGLFLILFGLMKKVAIANGLAPSVNSVFNSTGRSTWADIVYGTLLFSFQIYCDFSGYTDIARGVGKALGIDLLYNFNLPYFSRSPSEFWQRWHISLSSWLRDYLYIPLGGNRYGPAHLVQSDDHDGIRRPLARGGLELRALGLLPWGRAVRLPLRVIGTRWLRTNNPVRVSTGKGGFDASAGVRGVTRTVLLPDVLRMAPVPGDLVQPDHAIHCDTFYRLRQLCDRDLAANAICAAGLVVLIGFEILEYVAGTRTFYRAWPRSIRGPSTQLLSSSWSWDCRMKVPSSSTFNSEAGGDGPVFADGTEIEAPPIRAGGNFREAAIVTSWMLVFLVAADVTLNQLFPLPRDPRIEPKGRLQIYFNYGWSIEAKIRRAVGPTDETSAPIAMAGWVDREVQSSATYRAVAGESAYFVLWDVVFKPDPRTDDRD